MNIRKGLTRLLVVWLIVWAILGYWGWIVYDNSQTGMVAVLESEKPFEGYRLELMKSFNDNSAWGLKMQVTAIVAGILFPICAAILFFVGRWVYRGFKRTA